MKSKKKQSDHFGVPMIEYCREHEAYIHTQMEAGADCRELLELHKTKIQWIQHERLIHLLVTILTTIFLMFVFGLMWLIPGNPLVILMLAIVLVLLLFYFVHYFRLENTVQRWYVLADELYQKSKSK